MGITLFLVATVVTLLVASLVCGAKGFNKSAWICAVFLSLSLGAFVIACIRDPYDIIRMYGYEVTNLSMLLLIVEGTVLFIVCMVIAVLWLWRRQKKKTEPLYETRTVRGLDKSGAWIAEIRAGPKRFLVTVGSISALIPKK